MQRLPCQPTSQTWFMSTSKACGQFAQKVLIGPTPITRVGVNEVHCKLIHDKILDSHLVQPLQVAQYFLIIPPTHLLKTQNTNKTPSKVYIQTASHCFLQQTGIFRVRFITSRRIVTWCDISSSSASEISSFREAHGRTFPERAANGREVLGQCAMCSDHPGLVQFPSQTRWRSPSKIFHPRLRRPSKTRLVDVPGTTSQLDLNESNVLDVNTCGPIWWKSWWVFGMMGEDWVKGQWPLKPAK